MRKIKRFGRLFHNLSMQLILFYTVISFIVIAAGYYFSYAYSIDLIKRYNEKYLLEQFHQSEYNIQSMMREVDRLSMMFSGNSSVQYFLQRNYSGDEYDKMMVNKDILDTIGTYISNYSYINSIYIITDSGMDVGSSLSRTVNNDTCGMAIYQSEIYRNAAMAEPKFFWCGGKDTGFYNPGVKLQDTQHLITAARLIKPIYELSNKAMLVFNINESYLSSLYGNSDSKEGYTYIINPASVVISSPDGLDIGKKSSVFANIKKGNSFGSFFSGASGSQMQVVYYRMDNTGWYFIRNIPFSVFKKDTVGLQRTILLIFGISMLVIFLISVFWLKKMTKPLKNLADKMADMGSGNLGVTFKKIPSNEFGIVIRHFNQMSLSIKTLVQKNKQMEEEKRHLEIEALQYQINPHFIYNTLNMIKWMAAMSHQKNIVDCIIALGNIIRPAYKSMDSMCTIGEETNYINNYLKIMNWRYGNLIKFEIEIPDYLLSCRIPRFILQPIVENCVVHGMEDEKPLEIRIRVFETSDMLRILVSDNGAGMDEEKLNELNQNLCCNSPGQAEEKSVGLPNVARRIYLNCGEKSSMFITSGNGRGTVVSLSVPVSFDKPRGGAEPAQNGNGAL